MKFLVSLILLGSACLSAHAQYAPQAGLQGSTAISATDSRFVGWATHCSVTRGLMNIAQPSLGYVSSGSEANAVGAVDNTIVSLGDSGIAVATFAAPIYNGDGFDFVVFENGFLNPQRPEQAFLELAFVEVSSDGVNYTRFPASSDAPADVQIRGAGDYMDASYINNFAGKYAGAYGTPFDLDELANTPGLDVSNITHVRIVDVIGSIDAHTSHDKDGKVINDPYPTDFPTGGFDLDAIGVIHQVGVNSVAAIGRDIAVNIFPNPTTDYINIALRNTYASAVKAALTDATGKVLYNTILTQQQSQIGLAQYGTGIYYLQLQDTKGNRWVEKISKL